MRTLLLLSSLCVAGTAQATVVLKMDRAEMTQMSDDVLMVRVGAQRVVEEQPGALVTLTDLEVLESFKGKYETGDTVLLQQAGGVKGDWVMHIPGKNTYRFGETLVLFLNRHRDRVVPVGVGIGRMVVEGEGDSALLKEEYGDVAFAVRNPKGKMRFMHGPPPSKPVKLSVFRRWISSLLEGSR